MQKVVPIKRFNTLIGHLKKQDKKSVVVGGCFDILHPGHIFFLEKAKKAGDILVVLLESDEKVKKLKGDNRPIHSQKMRAKVLSALQVVDYIIMLPFLPSDNDYDELVIRLKPAVIAATNKDINVGHHLRSAKLSGATFKLVAKVLENHSTSEIINH